MTSNSIIEIVIADLLDTVHGEAILSLLNQYALDDMGGNCGLSLFTKQNLISELQKRNGVHVILAYDGDTPVGLSICFDGFSTFACKPLLNIHDLVVAKRYQGQGIAKQLLERIEEIALSLGCCKLTLEVLEGNCVAKAVYKKSGFYPYELNPQVGKALFWHKNLL